MKRIASLLAAVAVSAISLPLTAQAADTNTSPDTQTMQSRVPRVAGKGMPADAKYARAKEGCQAKSGDAKVACLDSAKATYRQERAVDESVAAAISRDKVQK